MLSREYGATRIAMIVIGVAMAIKFPFDLASERSGWVWDYPARNFAMEHMIVAVYVTMGLFLILGARDPVRYLPFVDFVIVSSVAHASVMLYDALRTSRTPQSCASGRRRDRSLRAVRGPRGAASEEALRRTLNGPTPTDDTS